jgi:hypothetical protein
MNISEYKEKIYISRSIAKWLKLQNKIYTHDEKLFLRNKFNDEIGIYN